MNLSFVVAKDQTGDYTTVQEAVEAAGQSGANEVVIHVSKGRYYEVVKIDKTKPKIHLIGEGSAKTVICFDNHAGKIKEDGVKLGTGNSASVFIDADGFRAEGITFQNSYYEAGLDHNGRQAVAVNTTGKDMVFLNCSFLGHQDTLYLRDGSCYLENCYIEGDIDFIFGAAKAVFSGCEIHSINPCNNDNNGYCTAASTREADDFGFIFDHCRLTAAAGMPAASVYLGRPWHPSKCDAPVRSYTVFYQCELGPHIRKEGWTEMGTTRPETERYYEFGSTGDGAADHTNRKTLTNEQKKIVIDIIKHAKQMI